MSFCPDLYLQKYWADFDETLYALSTHPGDDKKTKKKIFDFAKKKIREKKIWEKNFEDTNFRGRNSRELKFAEKNLAKEIRGKISRKNFAKKFREKKSFFKSIEFLCEEPPEASPERRPKGAKRRVFTKITFFEISFFTNSQF